MMRFLLLLLWAPRPASSLAILVADGLAPSGLKLLREAGADVLDLSERVDHFNVLETSLSDYDAVIVRSRSHLGAATLANGAAGKLRIVGRAGVGVDNIDCDACLQHGIAVVNTPGASASAVAELTIGHLLNACREMPRADHAVRSGGFLAFKQAAPLTASELRGKKLGLFGFGRVAQRVATVAHALGMSVFTAPTRNVELAAGLGVTVLPDVQTLFATCTHISLHCPLTPETANLVDLTLLKSMPTVAADGARCGSHLVNLARGGIVVEGDVSAALDAGWLTSYGTDVFEEEPVGAGNVLLGYDRVTCTPHIGAATMEAQDRVSSDVARSVLDVLAGRRSDACVVPPPGVA